MELEIPNLDNPTQRKNLVKALNIFRKLRKVSRARALELYSRYQDGTKIAVIITGQLIEPAEENHLLALYKKTFDSPVKPTFHINPKLLGGVRMKWGDEMIELTLNNITQ